MFCARGKKFAPEVKKCFIILNDADYIGQAALELKATT
jgi:hypothetical protein